MDGVARADHCAVLLSVVVAAVAQLTIVEGPSLLCVTKGLFWGLAPATHPDFEEGTGLDLDLEKVAATGSHGLVGHHRLEGVALADRHSSGTGVLIHKLHLFIFEN